MLYSIEEIRNLSAKDRGRFIKLLSKEFGVRKLDRNITKKIISNEDLSTNDVYEDETIASLYSEVYREDFLYTGSLTHEDVKNFRNALRSEKAKNLFSGYTKGISGRSNILTLSKNEHGEYDTPGALRLFNEFDKNFDTSGLDRVIKYFGGVLQIGSYNEVFGLLEYIMEEENDFTGLTEENYQSEFLPWSRLVSFILLNSSLSLDQKRIIVKRFLVKNNLKKNFVISLGYVLGNEFYTSAEINRKNSSDSRMYDLRMVEHAIEIFIEENNRIRVKDKVRNQFVANVLLGKFNEEYVGTGILALRRQNFFTEGDVKKLDGAESPYMDSEKQKEIGKRGIITTNEVLELSGFKHIIEKYEIDLFDQLRTGMRAQGSNTISDSKTIFKFYAMLKTPKQRLELAERINAEGMDIESTWLFETIMGDFDHNILYSTRYNWGNSPRIEDPSKFRKAIEEYVEAGMTPENTDIFKFNNNFKERGNKYILYPLNKGNTNILSEVVSVFRSKGFPEDQLLDFTNRNLESFKPGVMINETNKLSTIESTITGILDLAYNLFPDRIDEVKSLEKLNPLGLIVPGLIEWNTGLSDKKVGSLATMNYWREYLNTEDQYKLIKKHIERTLEKENPADIERLVEVTLEYIQEESDKRYQYYIHRGYLMERWVDELKRNAKITSYDNIINGNIEKVKKVIDPKYHQKLDDLIEEFNALKPSIELAVSTLS